MSNICHDVMCCVNKKIKGIFPNSSSHFLSSLVLQTVAFSIRS